MWINVTLDLSSVRRLISRHIFRMLFMAPQGMRGPGQRFLHQHTACFYIFGVPKDSSFDPFIKRLWVRQITAKKKGIKSFLSPLPIKKIYDFPFHTRYYTWQHLHYQFHTQLLKQIHFQLSIFAILCNRKSKAYAM